MTKKIIFLLIFILLIPLAVQAQDVGRFASVEIEIWSEYDQPAVLVIYRLVLPPETSLPADVSLRIPSAAGVPNAVASRQADGTLVNLTFEQQPAGEWSQLNFATTSPEIQVEYYDPTLIKDGETRHYEYQWPGDHSVDMLFVRVQQPFGVTNMQISPNLGEGVLGNDGLVYYTADVGSLDVGQSFKIDLDYIKESEGLSMSSLKVQSSAPIALPWMLGTLGVVLLVVVAIWYWQSGKQDKIQQKTRRTRRKRVKPPVVSQEDSDHIYCHQCGKRAQSGDRFCRACGKELRINSS
jgi:hypothetical protein